MTDDERQAYWDALDAPHEAAETMFVAVSIGVLIVVGLVLWLMAYVIPPFPVAA